MGIHKFNNWIKNKYPDILINNRKTYDHMYIDLNYLLHIVINNNYTESDFIFSIYRVLDTLIWHHNITQSITIAMDGSSPYSKIKLQRKRRQMIVTSNEINEKILSSFHLTPGTKFMKKLTYYIKKYIDNRKYWFRYRNIQFYVYSTMEPGEGEIKVIARLLKNNKNNIISSNLIVGSDADLIVMAMGLDRIYNIDILTKTNKDYETISIQNLLSIHSSTFGNINDDIFTLAKSPIRQDFVALSIMMGNDYLPKVFYFDYDRVWKIYLDTRKYIKDFLIKNGTFNFKFFREFMLRFILHIPKSYRYIHLKNYFSYTEKNIHNYLSGILWCIDMYKTGKCPMIDFQCANTAIMPAHILFYIEQKHNISIPRSFVRPLDGHVCALLVLPKKAYC